MNGYERSMVIFGKKPFESLVIAQDELEEEKGTEKWCKILVIAKGKMSLSQDAESR